MMALNIQCPLTHQWLYHTYFQNHPLIPLYKKHTTKFPAISIVFNQCWLYQESSIWVSWKQARWWLEKINDQKKVYGCIMPSYGSFMPQKWLKWMLLVFVQHHRTVHPLIAISRLDLDPRPLVQIVTVL